MYVWIEALGWWFLHPLQFPGRSQYPQGGHGAPSSLPRGAELTMAPSTMTIVTAVPVLSAADPRVPVRTLQFT